MLVYRAASCAAAMIQPDITRLDKGGQPAESS